MVDDASSDTQDVVVTAALSGAEAEAQRTQAARDSAELLSDEDEPDAGASTSATSPTALSEKRQRTGGGSSASASPVQTEPSADSASKLAALTD